MGKAELLVSAYEDVYCEGNASNTLVGHCAMHPLQTHNLVIFMERTLTCDLKIMRERSGLSNADLSQLLACNKERVSRLENGKARLKIHEVIRLSVIHGKPLEDLFRETTRPILSSLKETISQMPPLPANWERKAQDRTETLNQLAYRLQRLTNTHHERQST